MPKRTPTQHLARVRTVCLALPESTERLSHGEPTFFVKKKVFCMFANFHHNDGNLAVWVPAPLGLQEVLIQDAPKKYFRPPYVGPSGWIGIELPKITDKQLKFHIEEAWRLVAPKKVLAALESR